MQAGPFAASTPETRGAAAADAPQPPGPFPDPFPDGDTYTVPGDRDGPSEFPVVRYAELQPKVPGKMDFEHFHSSKEINWWLRKWAYEHPDITELYEVGKSFGGEPIYQLTITNKATGKDTDKPAAFFEGGRHSGEITSTESVLWLTWQLVEKHGSDPKITQLIDEKAIYLRPLNNPDGSDLYRWTAQTNRSSVRPHDSDGDGKLDEDPPLDLNGDGYATQMRKRVGPGKGTHVIDDRDPAGRVLRNVGQGNGDYLVYTEGIDHDGDGRIGEDGIGGLDLHRNYPYNWRPEASAERTGRGNTQAGAGAYPLSEPETRHVFTFLTSHPNVGVVNSMDTAVPMHLRGPSTCEEKDCMFASDLKLFEYFDEVGVSFTDYPWAGDVYRDYATRFGGEPEALFGHGPDFGYFQFGAVWYGDELWNGGRFTDYNKDGRFDDWERSRWCAENNREDCFLPWKPFEHETLGAVEIGGFNPKFWNQNAPAELLEEWAANQAKFNLAMAFELPRVEITDTKARALAKGQKDGATHEVTVTVRNPGRIPTALEQAKRVKIVRPDTVTVRLPSGAGQVVGAPPEFWLKGQSSYQATVRVKVNPGTSLDTVTVRASSTRGGVAERAIRWPG
ncbi:M14 family metallopeptidase [Actinopolymorpha alba]|uniref:M14 family metallopeptidase n=1 Tax=Actinopolymorpha alba TaxID=533267 RepID=UPI00192C3151|nr:M14 family metallopeptidase [Actinopolymorpha alba]